MLHNLAQLPRYRGLIQSLVARELKARYRGSVLGFFWSFINPLLLLLVYSFVFTYVMPARTIKGIEPYRAVHVLRHPAVDVVRLVADRIVGRADLRRQPDQEGAVPGGDPADRHACWRTWCISFSALPILAGFLIYYQRAADRRRAGAVSRSSSLVQFLFTLGCALILSALTVHFRDIRDILSNLLTFWFFATPIIYPYPVQDPHRHGSGRRRC